MKMSRFNRVLVLILVLLLAGAGLMTYVSRARYIESLPLVQTVELSSGRMHKSYTVTGTLRAEQSFERVIYAPADLRVASVNVVTGSSAAGGQTLISFDTAELEAALVGLKLSLYDNEAEKETLDTALSRADGDERDYIALQGRKNELEAEGLREDIAALEDIIEDGGVVAAGGIDIRDCIPQGTLYVARGQLLLRYVPFPTKKAITFTLPYCSKLPQTGGDIICDLPVIDADGLPQLMEQQRLEITGRTIANDVATFTVDVNVGSVYLHDGEQLTLTTNYNGGTDYAALVPRSAVELMSGGIGYIYVLDESHGVGGAELRARQIGVHILDYDDDYAALAEAPEAPVIRYADGVEDGMAVRTW